MTEACDLPEFNKTVVARIVGTKHHPDGYWHREGWAFMARWENEPRFTVDDEWSRELYDIAIKKIDADSAIVAEWVYVSDLPKVSTLRRAITDYAAIQPIDLFSMGKIQDDLRAIAGEKHAHRKTIASDECLLCKRDLRNVIHKGPHEQKPEAEPDTTILSGG
jgi:hypothetical protein